MILVAAIIFTVAVIGLLLWWLLIHTEGVYLGQRIVIWLYDIYASRYDNIVQNNDIEEHLHLAQPIMRRLARPTPLVLDVATGTGRLPLALCQHAGFEGHIIALDRSSGMLHQAIDKIHAEHFHDYVTFILGDGNRLPFDNYSFDLVTCMEALEFMPSPEYGLRELLRVLRPGGLLLTTQRINDPWMPGKLWSRPEMRELLSRAGGRDIEFEPWQYDYTKVWARKAGSSTYISSHSSPQ